MRNDQAMALVEKANPGAKAQDCAMYRNQFLVRVSYADPDEANYDPFFSVNPSTGSVKEFSVITDGNLAEIASCFRKK